MKGAQIMSSVLTVEQREQAGSDSYNRFEYQVHWIVCHIIGSFKKMQSVLFFANFTMIWLSFLLIISSISFFK